MIHIYTLKYGTKYPSLLVNNLYESILKYYPRDFIFYCYTDNTTGLNSDIKIIDLPSHPLIKEHWYKLDFFKSDFVDYDFNDEVIVMDIDQIIISNPTEMIDWPTNSGNLCSYTRWWSKEQPPINGGWYKFKANTMDYVYQKFYSDIEKWQLYYYENSIVHIKYFGEQNFVYDTVMDSHEVKLMPGEWVCKYHYENEDKNIKLNLEYERLFGEPLYLGGEWASKIKIAHFCEKYNSPEKFILQNQP